MALLLARNPAVPTQALMRAPAAPAVLSRLLDQAGAPVGAYALASELANANADVCAGQVVQAALAASSAAGV